MRSYGPVLGSAFVLDPFIGRVEFAQGKDTWDPGT